MKKNIITISRDLVAAEEQLEENLQRDLIFLFMMGK